MGIDAQIESLEQLAALDAEIRQLTEKFDAQRGDLDALRVSQGELEQRLVRDRASLSEMERTRGELQVDHRNIVQQLERSRERMQRSRNEREVQAAERELDELRRLQRDRDDEIGKMHALCEQARVTIEENEQKLAGLKERLQGSEEGTVSELGVREAEIAERRAGRAAILAKLPSLTGRRYEAMHSRGKVPIASTTDGTCRGCNVQLPPMLFHRLLARTQFEECPFCHRILWYTPPPAAPDASAPGSGESAPEGGAPEVTE